MKQTTTSAKAGATRTRRASGGSDGLATVAGQLVSRVITPRDLVMLTRERIQETLDEAAQRGRVTRKDGVRRPDRAERGSGPAHRRGRPRFPILGYDDLNATQVQERLKELSPGPDQLE